MIKLNNVGKTFGKKANIFTALTGVNLEIPSGKSVAIIGKSGSGKSTLMHLMSGLDRSTSGTVSIDGDDLSKMNHKQMDSFRANKIGFIFQSFFVEPNQTCFNNISLPLEILNISKGKRKAMIEKALKSVDIYDKRDEKAVNLSGGEKQRLSIARAIVYKPDFIYADEPTGNLDSENGDLIVKLLFDLNKNLGNTLLIVTHDIELAEKCEVQITLKDGKVIDIKGLAQDNEGTK